jgi:hypothetical protein
LRQRHARIQLLCQPKVTKLHRSSWTGQKDVCGLDVSVQNFHLTMEGAEKRAA